jgi:phosphoribosylformylglycinamidine synthase subunit PurQ / glutaminase
MARAFVLKGWGIECEAEMKRAAETVGVFSSVQDLVLPKLVSSAVEGRVNWPFEAGDWVLLPGGFSFSDHFGSGKLLALKLRELGFFEEVARLQLSLFGVCNGFQVLTESGLFGSETQLFANKPQGFKNRWIRLRQGQESFRLPVRHGEGRLSWKGELPKDVVAFLHYDEESFDNGSRERIAGLLRRQGDSVICGMMPHPEIALGTLDDPDVFATDYFEHHRSELWNQEGAGLKLMKRIFKKEKLL